MPPKQNTPPPPEIPTADHHDPARYDFFLNPPPPPKRKLISADTSKTKRLLIVAGGAILLIIVILVFVSLVFGGSSNVADLTIVGQDQTELVRISTEADETATEQVTKNLAVDIELGLTTNQTQLLNYLTAHGTKLSQKQLSATKDLTTDQKLQAAQAASDYDTVFAQISQTQLTAYAQAIKQAYQATPNKTQKQLLNNQYEAAELLLRQANTTTTTLSSQSS